MGKYKIGDFVVCEKRGARYCMRIDSVEGNQVALYSGRIVYLCPKYGISQTRGRAFRVSEDLLTIIENQSLIDNLRQRGLK